MRVPIQIHENAIMNPKFYTGIGSRQTPQAVQEIMRLYAIERANEGYILRSGAATGADTAFEIGCDAVNGGKNIFLPWKGFSGSQSKLFHISSHAYEMASNYHPAWNKCSDAVKKLHARNCYQVLGEDLNTPSDHLICWTPNGKIVGGTATAIKIALDWNIEVVNLYHWMQ